MFILVQFFGTQVFFFIVCISMSFLKICQTHQLLLRSSKFLFYENLFIWKVKLERGSLGESISILWFTPQIDAAVWAWPGQGRSQELLSFLWGAWAQALPRRVSREMHHMWSGRTARQCHCRQQLYHLHYNAGPHFGPFDQVLLQGKMAWKGMEIKTCTKILRVTGFVK